jgi:predicted secreted protein
MPADGGIPVHKAEVDVRDVKLNEPFEIALKAPRSSGFEWRLKLAQDALELRRHKYVPARTKSFGASGHEVFEFVPVKRGRLHLTFELKRAWENEVAEVRDFEVAVA